MEIIKEINIKNRTYYFFDGMLNIKNFNPNLLKIDKKSYKNIDIYYIGYITNKNLGDYESIHSVNPLYFIVGEIDRYIEEKNGNKYFLFAYTNKNEEVSKKDAELWNWIKKLIESNSIEKINDKPDENGKENYGNQIQFR